MKKNLFLTRALIWVLAMVMVPCGAFAQGAGGAPPAFSQQDLDQMLAPVALYPDSLLAQVLIAATYPDQVVEADRWLKQNPELKGDALNSALDRMNWDLSVKALAPFPQVLAMMAQETAWTQRLGQAFMAQQADVMDSVQKLRAKAQAAGNLKTTSEQRVVVKGEAIEIEPVNPEVVYIPRYDPVVVYGSWWWPTYPPYVYAPIWPGVAVGIGVGVAFGFWGSVAVGPVWGWGWGSWGWGSHNVNINVNRTVNINSTRNVNFTRNSIQTTNFHQAVASGRIGSSTARAAAFSGRSMNTNAARTGGGAVGAGRAGVGATGAGRTGMTGGAGRTGVTAGGAGGARPSATSVMQGLHGGGSAQGAGRTGNVSRGGGAATGNAGGGSRTQATSRSGSVGGGSRTPAVSRSGGSAPGGAGGGSRATGMSRSSGGAGARGAGAGAPRGGAPRGAAAPRPSGGAKGGSAAKRPNK